MTNTQLLFAVAIPTLIPTLAVVISIIRSDSSVERLRSEMRGDIRNLRSEIKSDFDSLRSDLRADIRILNSIAYEHAQRLTGLEGQK